MINTMQEPRRGSQLGDRLSLMNVPRRGTTTVKLSDIVRLRRTENEDILTPGCEPLRGSYLGFIISRLSEPAASSTLRGLRVSHNRY